MLLPRSRFSTVDKKQYMKNRNLAVTIKVYARTSAKASWYAITLHESCEIFDEEQMSTFV